MTDEPKQDQLTQPEIRELPAVEPRVESGPIAFGNDWPGLFIRGDHAANFALHLRKVLQEQTGMNWVNRAVLEGLLADLECTNLLTRHD